MSRVLIVSRNPAMAMGLSATDYEVVDIRPPGFGAWIDGAAEDVDALILDLESPQLALAAVNNLRAHGKLAPVLLVSSDRPGWDDPDMRDLPAAEVLPLPISKPILLSALEGLLGSAWATRPGSTFLPATVAEPPREAEFATAQALNELRQDPTEPFRFEDDLDSRITAVAVVAAPAPEVISPAAPSDKPAPEPRVQPAGPDTRRIVSLPNQSETRHVLDELDKLRHPVASRPDPQAAPARHKRVRRAAAAGHRPEPAPSSAQPTSPARQTVSPAGPDLDTIGLVRALARRVHQLYGVPETADVAIADAVLRTRADAGALVVPDEGVWRVAAGVDLRPMEHRYELHADSWLVREIALGHLGAIIEETDIARERLQGAPLASCRHLLVAPVPQVEALLILARREDPAFTEDDLAALDTLGAEAAPLLAAAMDTRALARTLWEFRDEVDLPR